jgi:hypothetical protein
MTQLQQLWNSINQSPGTFVAFIAAMAAVASAVVSTITILVTSFVSLAIARRQIRASVLSNNRQAWINALRDDLSELFELLDWLHLLRPGTYTGTEGYKFVDERRSRIRMLKYRIPLRLNPTEPDNMELLRKIDDLDNAQEHFEAKMVDTVKLSQSVLKREWIRVKRGR